MNFRQRLLIYLTAISAGALLISNLAATKLWDFFGVAVDGGLLVFPVTYIIGDLIVEFYGKKIAREVVYAGFVVNIIAILVFYCVILLPAYPGWTMQEAYASVLGFTPRIILGSLIAYLTSNLLNTTLFVKLKNGNGIFARSFIARALGSSVFAHFVDSMIFETIAFIGVLSMKEFLLQAIFAYVLGMLFEAILSPVEILIAKYLKGKIDYAEI